jgi:hypothetical protein
MRAIFVMNTSQVKMTVMHRVPRLGCRQSAQHEARDGGQKSQKP